VFTVGMRDNVVSTEGQSFEKRAEGNDKEDWSPHYNRAMMTTTLFVRIVVYFNG
jgi:hypothetical protein